MAIQNSNRTFDHEFGDSAGRVWEAWMPTEAYMDVFTASLPVESPNSSN